MTSVQPWGKAEPLEAGGAIGELGGVLVPAGARRR
jgi:hypothetical protein